MQQKVLYLVTYHDGLQIGAGACTPAEALVDAFAAWQKPFEEVIRITVQASGSVVVVYERDAAGGKWHEPMHLHRDSSWSEEGTLDEASGELLLPNEAPAPGSSPSPSA